MRPRQRVDAIEPRQDCRRFQLLRDWSHERESKSPRHSPRRERAVRMVKEHRAEARVRMGHHHLDCRKIGKAETLGCTRPSAWLAR